MAIDQLISSFLFNMSGEKEEGKEPIPQAKLQNPSVKDASPLKGDDDESSDSSSESGTHSSESPSNDEQQQQHQQQQRQPQQLVPDPKPAAVEKHKASERSAKKKGKKNVTQPSTQVAVPHPKPTLSDENAALMGQLRDRNRLIGILGIAVVVLIAIFCAAMAPGDRSARMEKTKSRSNQFERAQEEEYLEEILQDEDEDEDEEEEEESEGKFDAEESLRRTWRSSYDSSYPISKALARSKPSPKSQVVEDKSEIKEKEKRQLTSNPLKFYMASSEDEEKEILTPRDISVLDITNNSCKDGSECDTLDIVFFVAKNRALAIANGYATARLVCLEASKSVGWHVSRPTALTTTTAKASPSAGKTRKPKSHVSQTTERFHNPLYLSSASVYSPYYCVNLPLSETLLARGSSSSPSLASFYGNFKNRVGTKRTRKEMEKQQARQLQQNNLGLTNFYKSWHSLVEGNSAVSYTTSKSDSFVTSVIHNSVVMGFLNKYVVMRNLLALGHSDDPKLQVSLVSYTSIIDALRLILEGHSQILQRSKSMNAQSVCMCGPHINMARHIVGYANARRKRAVVYFEPIITSAPPSPDDEKTVTYDLREALFPWSWNLLDNLEFDETSPHYDSESLGTEFKPSLVGGKVTSEIRSYISYAVADTLFRRKVLPETAQSLVVQPKITVEYMRVDKGEGQTYYSPSNNDHGAEEDDDSMENEDSESVLYHEHVHDGKRTVTEVEGQEALCIQYCQQVAYSLAGYAESRFDRISSTIDAKLSESPQRAQDSPTVAEPKRGAKPKTSP